MDEPRERPKIPEDRIEPPPRQASEMKPGDRLIISAAKIHVDEERHAWLHVSSPFQEMPLLAGLSLRVERTEDGFIVWLDRRVTFRPQQLYTGSKYLPVVEFREAPEKDDF